MALSIGVSCLEHQHALSALQSKGWRNLAGFLPSPTSHFSNYRPCLLSNPPGSLECEIVGKMMRKCPV